MTLESSITELNASVQALIKVISALDPIVDKPKAVKASKPTPDKKVEPTPDKKVEAAVEERDSFNPFAAEIYPVHTVACVLANVPELNEVISEMKAITDRKVLFSLLDQFESKTASGIPANKRAAFIEAIHMELQKGAA